MTLLSWSCWAHWRLCEEPLLQLLQQMEYLEESVLELSCMYHYDLVGTSLHKKENSSLKIETSILHLINLQEEETRLCLLVLTGGCCHAVQFSPKAIHGRNSLPSKFPQLVVDDYSSIFSNYDFSILPKEWLQFFWKYDLVGTPKERRLIHENHLQKIIKSFIVFFRFAHCQKNWAVSQAMKMCHSFSTWFGQKQLSKGHWTPFVIFH